ncbi:MAG: hypothetical protein EOO40_01935 [Deltaproteobacteria bacterium]|nr:MAG: hypothetical protein EOO40_01935 [Deltaproteobacteria bacterium]
MDGHLNIFEKACCEAVWRAATQRGQQGAPLYVDPTVAEARLQLARLVQGLPHDIMSAITLREVTQYGQLAGGYSARWDTTAINRSLTAPRRAGKPATCPAAPPPMCAHRRASSTEASDGSDAASDVAQAEH